MLKEKFFLFNLTLNLILIQAMLWILYLKRNLLPPEIPLLYLREWGPDQLTIPYYLWLLPALPTVIFIFNTIFARLVYQRGKILAQLLVVFATICSLLTFASLFRIVNLVTP